jgi:hypothetical protein
MRDAEPNMYVAENPPSPVVVLRHALYWSELNDFPHDPANGEV